eukprot:scaffold16457_cov109-Isochrysis_galbana.AAC.5
MLATAWSRTVDSSTLQSASSGGKRQCASEEGPTNSEKEPSTSAIETCTSSVNLPASISPFRKGSRSERVLS